MLDSKTFELILQDKDKQPIRSIRVVTGQKNKVITGIETDAGDSVHTAELSDDGYVEIIKAIKDHIEVFTIHDIYVPEALQDKQGCITQVYFATAEKKVRIEAQNLEACRDRYEECPQGAVLIELIERIADVLEKEGVDPIFFRFEP